MAIAPSSLRIRPFDPATEKDQLISLWQACGLTRPWNSPEADIDRMNGRDHADILVAMLDGQIIGSAMVGEDGHRGWIYYLAVAPSHQRLGIGESLMRAAEQWLGEKQIPKMQLMIRHDNRKAQEFYAKIGYGYSETNIFERWISGPALIAPEEQYLTVTITDMLMQQAPAGPAISPPSLAQPVVIVPLQQPNLHFYRYLQSAVGEPWLWWERRQLDDATIAAIIHHPKVSVHLLTVGNNPAGFIELDYRKENHADIAYFGLLPDYIGSGLGPYLLDWGIRQAWQQLADGLPADAEPTLSLGVNTCDLDHPKALVLYQKMGFTITRSYQKAVLDPRVRGLINPQTKVLSPTEPRADHRARMRQ